MKKIVLIFTLLIVSVMTTACINNLAIEELNNKATEYMNNGDTETAICRLKSSLDLDNEIYQTHYNLALAYNAIGNYTGAIEEINKVIELKPDNTDVYYPLAIAKEALALKILEKEADQNGNVVFTVEEISDFNTKASEAIENYNKYLVVNISPEETQRINEHIEILNDQLKKFSSDTNPEQETTQQQTQDEQTSDTTQNEQ